MKMMIFKIYTKGGYLKEYNREFFYMKCAFMRNAAYYYNLFAMDVWFYKEMYLAQNDENLRIYVQHNELCIEYF